MLLNRLKELAAARAGAVRVRAMQVGGRYLAVTLEDGRTGTAFTFRSVLEPAEARAYGEARHGIGAADLLADLGAADLLHSATALAVCNAVVNTDREAFLEGDILEILVPRRTDRIGMVGCFQPLVPPLKAAAAELTIFEMTEEPLGELRPYREAYTVLPRCDVALITATSIINGTVDGLLAAAAACREVIVLGASTPFLPEAFGGTPVTLLSGVVVVDGPRLLASVGRGDGVRQFGPHVRKVNLRLKARENGNAADGP